MIDRRSFLQGATVLALTGSARATMQPDTIRLWPDGPPGGGGPAGPMIGAPWGTVSHVRDPVIEIVRPGRPNGTAVLVAVGGGYTQIALAGEGAPAARWLAGLGITAFDLTYRLPGEGWSAGPLAPLQDAQRALRLIRAGAEPFGIDARRIGVLGFSAGGHLLAMAAARSQERTYATLDAADEQSARPDFAAMVYPVVTLLPPYDGTSSRRQLVGTRPTPEAASAWSVQTHLRKGSPPTFLVHAEDDPIVDWRNSRILDETCRRVGVPVEFHRLATGGHGFALGRAGTASTAWPSMAQAWLKKLGAIPGGDDRVSAL